MTFEEIKQLKTFVDANNEPILMELESVNNTIFELEKKKKELNLKRRNIGKELLDACVRYREDTMGLNCCENSSWACCDDCPFASLDNHEEICPSWKKDFSD